MFKVISLRSITLLWFGIASKLVLLSLCATVIVYCLLFIIFRSLQLFEEGADEGDVVIVIGEAASLAGVGGTVVAAEGTAEGVDEVSAIGAPTCAGTGNAIPKDNATIIRSLFIPRWCLQSFQVDIHITEDKVAPAHLLVCKFLDLHNTGHTGFLVGITMLEHHQGVAVECPPEIVLDGGIAIGYSGNHQLVASLEVVDGGTFQLLVMHPAELRLIEYVGQLPAAQNRGTLVPGMLLVAGGENHYRRNHK